MENHRVSPLLSDPSQSDITLNMSAIKQVTDDIHKVYIIIIVLMTFTVMILLCVGIVLMLIVRSNGDYQNLGIGAKRRRIRMCPWSRMGSNLSCIQETGRRATLLENNGLLLLFHTVTYGKYYITVKLV